MLQMELVVLEVLVALIRCWCDSTVTAGQTRLESSGVILAAQMCDGAKERCWLLSAEVHSRRCRTLSTNGEYDSLDKGRVAFAPDGPSGAVWASNSASRTKLTCRLISAWRWSCLLRTRCRDPFFSFCKGILLLQQVGLGSVFAQLNSVFTDTHGRRRAMFFFYWK